VTDETENPESPKDKQELTLDEQLDALLLRLEEVEPSLVPKDLRKQPAAEQPLAQSPQPTAEPAEVDQESSVQPTEPLAETTEIPEPISEAQPDAVEASADVPDPQTSSQDSGLESQLDALLNEMSQDSPAAPAQEPAPAQAVSAIDTEVDLDSVEQLAADLIDQQIDSAIKPDETADEAPPPKAEAQAETTTAPQSEQAQPDQAQAKPAAPVSLSEDDLSNQIASLLNDIQQTGSETAPPAEPAETEQAAEETVPEPTQAVAQVPEAPPDPAPTEENDPLSIGQIDEMLADSANAAVQQAGTEPQDKSLRVPGTQKASSFSTSPTMYS